MTLPTFPYAESEDVAVVLRPLLKHKSDFDDTTFPTKADVDKLIRMVASHIQMAFMSCGYVIPFIELDDEEWLDAQTEYLKFVVVLGTSSMIMNKAIKVASSRGANVSSNADASLTLSYDSEISNIKNELPFRAGYRVGSKAEQRLLEPYSPTTDVLYGTLADPMAHQSWFNVSYKMYELQKMFDDVDFTLAIESVLFNQA